MIVAHHVKKTQSIHIEGRSLIYEVKVSIGTD